MCLTLRNKSVRSKTATEDIIVYKIVRIVQDLPNCITDFHGKEFEAVVGHSNVNGKLSVQNGNLYLCTNNLVGRSCDNKFGYNHSYIFDCEVRSIIVDGQEITSTTYQTPFYHAIVKIGETYTAKMIKIENAITVGLHSIASEKEVKKYFNHFSEGYRETSKIVKCVIPKGSRYFDGTFDCNHKNDLNSLASNTLKYLEFINV